jgi:hypothetical protein
MKKKEETEKRHRGHCSMMTCICRLMPTGGTTPPKKKYIIPEVTHQRGFHQKFDFAAYVAGDIFIMVLNKY